MLKAYFVSDIDCALKIDGKYLGIIDKNLYSHTLNGDELLEFLPLNSDFSPFYSLVNGTEIKSFNLAYGKLFYPVFKSGLHLPFKLLGQRRVNLGGKEVVVTLISDGGVKFYVDGAFYVVSSLPFIPKNFDVTIVNDVIVIVFVSDKTAVFIYDFNGNEVFKCTCSGASIDKALTIKNRFGSVIKADVLTEYSLSSDFKMLSQKEHKEKNFYDIHPSLFTLAFFELVAIGVNVKEVLTPKMSEKSTSLKDFLGKVIRVLPSPNNPNQAWLVSDDKVSEASLDIRNGLIDNIYINDY